MTFINLGRDLMPTQCHLAGTQVYESYIQAKG